MATLIRIGDVLDYRPMSRSKAMLEYAAEILNTPRYDARYLQMDFAVYLASVLRLRVEDSINRQKIGRVAFKHIYPKLSEEYNESKPRRARNKFWWNTRHLVDHLTVWRTGDVVRVGFKGNAYYPGTRTRVLQVVLWMEKGTKTMPARPLFTPHARFISRNVSEYFKRYMLIRFGVTL